MPLEELQVEFLIPAVEKRIVMVQEQKERLLGSQQLCEVFFYSLAPKEEVKV